VPAITRVLVPVDFSPSSRAALDYATFLADALGASVIALHVWEPPGYVGPDTLALLPVAAGQPGWDDKTRAEVTRELEVFLGRPHARPKKLETEVMAGTPADAILSAAARDGADLIVMGTHGRTGLSRLLLGSVAEAVFRRAPCPVLTIRTPGKSPREPVPL
jgi:nucleotide-binding universal stress UspA family protein